jgi:acyl-coenzyme A thioesterase PaaI-like protein
MPEPGRVRRAVTLSMTTSYLGQARSGLITCSAERRGGGNTVFMATGEVRDAAGTLLALGEGVFRYIAEKAR